MVYIEKRPHITGGRSSALHFRYLTCLLDRGHTKGSPFFMKNVFNKVLDENHVDFILTSDVLFKYYVGKTIMYDTMSESECEIKIKIINRRKMETNYQNLQYTDDEKAAGYVKAIIKAVDIACQL